MVVVVVGWLAGWPFLGRRSQESQGMPEMENPRPSAVCGLITLSYN